MGERVGGRELRGTSTLATSCEELTHWKTPWCWEGLGAGGEGDNRGLDGWMASPTQWTWVWTNSGRWWRTGNPGVLQSMGSQRVRHNWATEQQGEGGLPKGHLWTNQEKRVTFSRLPTPEPSAGNGSPVWISFLLTWKETGGRGTWKEPQLQVMRR